MATASPFYSNPRFFNQEEIIKRALNLAHDHGVFKAVDGDVLDEGDKIDKILQTVAMVTVFGSTVALLNSDLDLEPHQFARLADNPKIKEVGEQLLLSAVVALCGGRKSVGNGERLSLFGPNSASPSTQPGTNRSGVADPMRATRRFQ